MKLEERCMCGAHLVLSYSCTRITREDERQEAHKQIDNFRRRHRGCLPARADYDALVERVAELDSRTIGLVRLG